MGMVVRLMMLVQCACVIVLRWHEAHTQKEKERENTHIIQSHQCVNFLRCVCYLCEAMEPNDTNNTNTRTSFIVAFQMGSDNITNIERKDEEKETHRNLENQILLFILLIWKFCKREKYKPLSHTHTNSRQFNSSSQFIEIDTYYDCMAGCMDAVAS